MKRIYALFFGYFAIIFSLFFYSYTQVDLSLTLSHLSIWRTIETAFQYIGYFNRPLSTYIYCGILLLLFVFYFLFLKSVRENKVTKKQLWFVILLSTAVLTFSYNAFSYDLFNYIFDARIFTHYHLNPYQFKPLDFPNDPMLSFMHWTHRTYPYGPTWLFVTVPLSFIGFQIFLPTLFLFKTLASVSFLGTTFYIGKIVKKIAPENELYSVAFFALNPLAIIESLVSAHLDIVMLYLFMLSLWFLLERKHVKSLIFFLLSIGVKYVTLFILPVMAFLFFKHKKISFEKSVLFMIFLMILGIVAQSVRTNFQPWYLLDVLPLTALLARKNFILFPASIITIAALFLYIPFLFTGGYDSPVPMIFAAIMAVGIFAALIPTALFYRELRNVLK